MSNIEARVASLHEYPIKSCSGLDYVNEGETLPVTERGFSNDRLRVVVNPEGGFLSQRDFSSMALIKPRIEGDALIVAARDEASELVLPMSPVDNGLTRNLVIWGNELQGVDDGDIAAQWISDYLGTKARIVHMSGDFIREKKGGRFGYADSYPFLIASEESLQDLNERIQANGGESIPMDRFRPNIVVSGIKPYAEDQWGQVVINGVELRVVKPCIRCPIPQVNQETGVKGKEPIRTLYNYRRVSKKDVIFAQKAVHTSQGQISVGDKVIVTETKDPPLLLV